MRSFTAFVLQLSILVRAIPLDRRDDPPAPAFGGLGSLFSGFATSQKAMKIEEIKPLLRPDAKRVRMTYGPYKLKAANSKEKLGNGFSMDPAGTGYLYTADKDFPRDITVLETKATLVNESFLPAEITEGIYNHHIAWFEHNTRPVSFSECGNAGGRRPMMGPGGMGMTVFIGGTTEDLPMTYWNEKLKTGLYVGKNDQISMMLDFVNYNNVPRTVYTIEEIEYMPGKLDGLKGASQTIMNPAQCGSSGGLSQLSNPSHLKKQFTFAGNDIVVSKDGYLFNLRAHLHDGGDKMTAKLNGKQVCESKAVYGGPGHVGKDVDGKEWSTIASTTLCDVITLKKGDRLSLEAFYDMDAHPARKQSHGGNAEVMALLSGYFTPAN